MPAEVCNGRDEDCDGQVDEGGDVCVLFVASRAAPAGAVGFGSVIAAAGDLDGDGIGDAVVGAPAGEVGVVAIVSGADGGVIWSVPGAATFGAAVAAARQGGAPAVFVGQPGGDNGVVVQLDAAGGEVTRWPGSDDFRAGRQLVAIDDAPWFAMADRDAMATFFGPAGGVRLVPIGGWGGGDGQRRGRAGDGRAAVRGARSGGRRAARSVRDGAERRSGAGAVDRSAGRAGAADRGAGADGGELRGGVVGRKAAAG
ncbi:MAG: putative metal-binding motif-containing protein [Myxococcales bacterium]|nr:putative metal-binding motif-containing protein [Myxococcales bacterium]